VIAVGIYQEYSEANKYVHLYLLFSVTRNLCFYYTTLWQHVSVSLDHHQANINITFLTENSYINWYIMFMECIYHVITLCFSYRAPVWCTSECVFHIKTQQNIYHSYKWKWRNYRQVVDAICKQILSVIRMIYIWMCFRIKYTFSYTPYRWTTSTIERYNVINALHKHNVPINIRIFGYKCNLYRLLTWLMMVHRDRNKLP
jgi:hypothetical protein